ncbi:sugar phosphate isomerase/epimerase family protein [Actinoplanes sp. NBRC 101535]|uniref:sugar phosphate isomerase/epimerase family protein n=1 Tax=Actinoplanes sp. NBRC 101535 TaxID=3032196 RepID=UPI0024A3A625|nr:sugar phosphate isomerase/epimerase family protein [Actinoplanes sp. NBRC 101535]GLY02758.1 hypothetical protein Acsp01_31370 [Actinoplanes sp. NBRC 101535]
MSTLAVSSFSLFQRLGPLVMEKRGPDGELAPLEIPMPAAHTLEEFVAAVRPRFGVSAVEICQLQLADSSPARISRLKDVLDENDVEVTGMPIDVGDLGAGNEATRRADADRVEYWLDVAARLGSSAARVNLGTDPDLSLSRVLDRLADTAASKNLQLLVENHGGVSSDPDFLLELRAEVGADRLGILLDLGNFDPLVGVSHGRFAGADVPDTGLDTTPVYERIARLAPHAAAVHAKAFDPASDGTPLLDLDRALTLVRDAGYRGPFGVEWEGVLGDPWEQAAGVVAQVRKHFPEY